MTAAWPLIKRTAKTYILPRTGTLVNAVLLMILSAAMTGAMAKLMEPVIDKVFTATNKEMLWAVALSVFAVFTIRGFATYGHTILMNKVVQRAVSDIQRDMFGHLVYSDLAFFHGNQSGQLMSRFIADTALIRS
ncbi:MAG: ABC transporter transmembrane domain-containing protein, partial [Alphaproteobacteria bacterium]